MHATYPRPGLVEGSAVGPFGDRATGFVADACEHTRVHLTPKEEK
jgi:hypothetical protein